MKTRILLICRPGKACDMYRNLLQPLPVQVDVFASFAEYFRKSSDAIYNGILFDLPTLIKMSQGDKALAHELISVFPSLRVRWDEQKGGLRTLYFGTQIETEPSLELFITGSCASFQPRPFRHSKRVVRHLNLLLSRDGSFSPETTIKTFTANVSRDGTFIYSMDEWKPGDRIWLRYNPVDPEPPIVGEVCWSIRWGQADCIPGIGVKFIEITERQRDQIVGGEV